MNVEQKNTNKQLAELLFPNVKMSVQDYLDAYPPRNLKKGAEVTRLAPSPTGYLHIGSVYGAFIDKLIAYHSGDGVFYLRLEDTDAKREVENAGNVAYDMLCLYGLKPDEGYAGDDKPQIGAYGNYVQSKRTEIYKAFSKELVARGRAFPCFCHAAAGKDEIFKRREEELLQTDDIEGKDVCRDLSFEQIKQNLKDGKPFAIRLKSLGNGERLIKIKDEIKGEREIRENSKDIVLLKSNGTPPYALAHVVDDTLMHTTTVVRGEEWYPSLSAHLEVFDALGLNPPKYAHTPVMCKFDEDGNKRKFSKRKDPESDARFFVEKGYPVESVMEYLLNLINSGFEDWRKQHLDASIFDFPFKVSKIGSNNPIFGFEKLNDCSKQVISRFSAEKIFERTLAWAEQFDKNFATILKNKKDMAINLFAVDRTGKNPRKDIAMWSEVSSLYDYMFVGLSKKTLNDFDFDTRFDNKTIAKILEDYLKIYDVNDDKQTWFEKIKSICAPNGFCGDMKEFRANPQKYLGSVADVSGIIRVATTTKRNTPDLFCLLQLLGKDEVSYRLHNAINMILKK